MTTRISYWLDRTSDYDCPVWIVDEGDEYASETLSMHDTEDAARAEAMRQALERGIPCVRVDAHGVSENLIDAACEAQELFGDDALEAFADAQKGDER